MSEGWGMEDKRKSIAEDGKGCAVKSSSPVEVDLDWAMDGKGKAEEGGRRKEEEMGRMLNLGIDQPAGGKSRNRREGGNERRGKLRKGKTQKSTKKCGKYRRMGRRGGGKGVWSESGAAQ